MEQGTTGLGEGVARVRERRGAPTPIYSVELEVFEGPLDLLLHLVRKHELDILDIPIAFVTTKYLEYLDVMRALDLEIAGDYLVMAATLAFLKSRELLPPEPRKGEEGEGAEEEGEDPREALIRRLLEYERFKQAAAELDSLPVSGRDVFARGADIEAPPIDPGLAPVSLFSLAEAYYRVLTRAKVKSTHDVTIEPVTVAQRIQQLALMLDERPSFDFEDLFYGRTWSSEKELRMMLVVTLMSVLEMVKLGVAGVQQPQDSTTIRIYRRATVEETRELMRDYDEDLSFGAPAEGTATPSRSSAPAVDPDVAEEAALLAEALAAVQEPEEPVVRYDGEPDADGPAANDERMATSRGATEELSDAVEQAERFAPDSLAEDDADERFVDDDGAAEASEPSADADADAARDEPVPDAEDADALAGPAAAEDDEARSEAIADSEDVDALDGPAEAEHDEERDEGFADSEDVDADALAGLADEDADADALAGRVDVDALAGLVDAEEDADAALSSVEEDVRVDASPVVEDEDVGEPLAEPVGDDDEVEPGVGGLFLKTEGGLGALEVEDDGEPEEDGP